MQASLEEILNWEKQFRIKFINSISGYKGVHLIGTANKEKEENLAIFNSVVHIGADPPYLGFVMRPLVVERNTYNNIKETGLFTINHVHKSFLKNAHYTSVKFPSNVSEFEKCDLESEYLDTFEAPFVKESAIKIGLKFVEEKSLLNGTILMIGEIQKVVVEEEVIEVDGQLDLEKVNDVCVTGLNQYSRVTKLKSYPYARIEELPNFKQKERPDHVVYDKETESYHSSILPYATSMSAPRIELPSVSLWKSSSVAAYNHSLNNKVEILKKEYNSLIEDYNTNEKLYQAKMNFEPIIGQEYHLYTNDKTDVEFLSLVPPNQWKHAHLGTFKLNHEKVWEKIIKQN